MIIFASSQPCLLILEGAALFGIESSTIKISKITIGADIDFPWIDKKH